MVEWLGGGRESGVRPPALSSSTLIVRLGLERLESPMQRAEHPCVKARAGDPSANPIAPQEFWAPAREEDFISFLLFSRPGEDYSRNCTTPLQSQARTFSCHVKVAHHFKFKLFFGIRKMHHKMSWGRKFSSHDSHSHVHSFIPSLNTLIYTLTYPFIHPSIDLSIHQYIHPSTRSLKSSPNNTQEA